MSTRKKLDDDQDKFLRGQTAKPAGKSLSKDEIDMATIKQILKPKTSAPTEQRVRLTVDLDKSLHRRLAIQSTLTEKSQSEIVRELLEAVLPPLPE